MKSNIEVCLMECPSWTWSVVGPMIHCNSNDKWLSITFKGDCDFELQLTMPQVHSLLAEVNNAIGKGTELDGEYRRGVKDATDRFEQMITRVFAVYSAEQKVVPNVKS